MRERSQTDSLRLLLHCSIPGRMTREEELALLERAKAGDRRAAEELIGRFVRYVLLFARSYYAPGMALEDLMQEGLCGLLKAMRRFDTRRGLRFTTYAAFWIKAYLARSVSRARATPGWADERGAEERGHEEQFVARGASPAASFAERELRESVRREMSALDRELTPLARVLVERRIAADEPLSLQEIGARFGLSRERVRQVEIGVKQRLALRLAPLHGQLGEAA